MDKKIVHKLEFNCSLKSLRFKPQPLVQQVEIFNVDSVFALSGQLFNAFIKSWLKDENSNNRTQGKLSTRFIFLRVYFYVYLVCITCVYVYFNVYLYVHPLFGVQTWQKLPE